MFAVLYVEPTRLDTLPAVLATARCVSTFLTGLVCPVVGSISPVVVEIPSGLTVCAFVRIGSPSGVRPSIAAVVLARIGAVPCSLGAAGVA